VRPTEPPPAPLRNKGSDLEVDNLALEGVTPELAPSDFVSQNNETLATLMLGSPDVHDRLGRRRSLSESPPSSDSEDRRRKRRKRVSSSSSDSSDNEDEETRHWKSRNGYLSCRAGALMIEELRRAFRLNFTQRKKCAKNPVKLARVKQRQGESTSAYVERYKDECIHVKAVPQTFDELMKCTRSFIQGETAAADNKKSYSNYKSQEQPRRQSNDHSSNRNNSYRNQRGGRGNDKYTPLTKTPKELLSTEGANFSKPPPMRTLEERHMGNGKVGSPVKNIKEGTDKQKSRGKKDTPKDKADTIYMVQSWHRKTRQKVNQKFYRGSEISFSTLTADNTVVEPLTIKINAGGHDIYRKIRLLVFVGNEEHSMTTWITFMVIRSPSPCNGIIGRPGISSIRAVPSTAHWMLKFPVDGGIVTIYNTTIPPRECNTVACDATQTQTQHAAKVINLKVAIHPDYPEQEVSIGGSLSDRDRAAMCALLQRNLDIFAWEPKHMTGVPRSITEHKLKIQQGYSPIRQKKRGQAPKRAKAILEEVHKLVDAGIMREVYYHDWLSNLEMVKRVMVVGGCA
nr:reverse transcriptase domain-containing protein [Tanacetum cinerariifolium]